jgi:hypothetical protein
MKKDQGSLEIESAEGGDELELTVTGNQVGLAVVIQTLKAKLKQYGVKDLDNRVGLKLTLLIPPPPAEDPVEEQATRRKLADRYPDTKPGRKTTLD